MTTVLILGATGNIGSLTAGTMSRTMPDVKLRLASSRASGCERLRELHPHSEVVQADWYDEASLVRAMKVVDKVFIVTPDFVTDESVVTPNIIRAVKAVGSIQQLVRIIAIPPGLTADKLAPEFLATRAGANMHVLAKPLLDASGLPVTYINVPCWIMFNLPWFLAPEIKAHRRLAMPTVTDSARRWVSEGDIADVVAKVLADPPALHIGKEHVLTGAQRYRYLQIAELLSEELGEKVDYADDDRPLREAMGDTFDSLMTYFRHETSAYEAVPATDTVERLLGRRQETLQDYLKLHRNLFV
jgi:NAD(P)H dehydrogenase (quinone)